MTQSRPPLAPIKAHWVKASFGATRYDPYYWLRDDERNDPTVLRYLKEENCYADALLAPLRPLEKRLYSEITSRILDQQTTVPYLWHEMWYYTRYLAGSQYPMYCRCPNNDGLDVLIVMQQVHHNEVAEEQVLLDVNQLALGKAFFQVSMLQVSWDNQYLAWAEDRVGRRQYTIRIKEISSGRLLDDVIEGVAPALVWGANSDTLFYIENDPETLLTKSVKKHLIGTSAHTDQRLYQEPDDSYYLQLDVTRDEQFLVLSCQSTLSSELRYAPLDLSTPLVPLAEREPSMEYDADHYAGQWVIRTNIGGAANYQLMRAPSQTTHRCQWQPWIAHDPTILIESFLIFDQFVAVEQRQRGCRQVCVIGHQGDTLTVPSSPASTVALAVNAEPKTPWLRVTTSSLITPEITSEIHVVNRQQRQLYQQVVPGYDASCYVTEQRWVTASDGQQIPVSVAYRKNLPKDGSAALYQYAYGSYGHALDPEFSPVIPSLLDRGIVYAIAHVRGGQELGRAWYDAGRLQRKKNTFTDFVAVTKDLVEAGYAHPKRVAACGGSAGGLLIGVIANIAAEHYRVLVAQVPFVDILTTMLDPSIPLTTNEYDEWGYPERQADYEVMLAYSPYDNVHHQIYPALYVLTGLWDSQVQYWEPAKWVAKLRQHQQGSFPILLRTDFDAGHGGQSGRLRRFQAIAEQLAFVIDQLTTANGMTTS